MSLCSVSPLLNVLLKRPPPAGRPFSFSVSGQGSCGKPVPCSGGGLGLVAAGGHASVEVVERVIAPIAIPINSHWFRQKFGLKPAIDCFQRNSVTLCNSASWQHSSLRLVVLLLSVHRLSSPLMGDDVPSARLDGEEKVVRYNAQYAGLFGINASAAGVSASIPSRYQAGGFSLNRTFLPPLKLRTSSNGLSRHRAASSRYVARLPCRPARSILFPCG